MLTAILTALILATEPAPALGAAQARLPCMSSAVEHPQEFVMPAYDWAPVLVNHETACEPTEHAEVTMAAMGFADPFADVQHEPDVVLPDGGADAPGMEGVR